MKTDPRKACSNEREARGWAFIHDAITHPLMALTGWSALSLRFHNWTSEKAWPRASPAQLQEWEVDSRFGLLTVRALSPSVYAISHPKVKHVFVTNAHNPYIAARKAGNWFRLLEAEFGGVFSQ